LLAAAACCRQHEAAAAIRFKVQTQLKQLVVACHIANSIVSLIADIILRSFASFLSF
jgi:hypothetical protein